MFTTILFPNFKKLKSYFNDLTDDHVALIEKNEGVDLHLEYLDQARYHRISDELLTKLTVIRMEEHHSELLYLIVKIYESLEERIEALWRNYDDDLTAREVATFLLAYKTSTPEKQFHLSAKPITGSITIKDTAIARWMAKQIYLAIEQKNYTLDLFGEKLIYNLFGESPTIGQEISIDRLNATANLKPRKPSVGINKLYVEFCLYLLPFLNEHTPLKTNENVKLSNEQGRFLFDVMTIVGYVNPEKIASNADSYVAALFQKYVK